MTDMSTLTDDVIVDAMIMEVAGLMGRLIKSGEAGSIDLLGMPLSENCVALIEQRLGRGEVTVRLDAAGDSDIHETGFSGVWWVRHSDEAGRVVARLIEVTLIPAIVCADMADVRRAHRRLPGSTSFARRST